MDLSSSKFEGGVQLRIILKVVNVVIETIVKLWNCIFGFVILSKLDVFLRDCNNYNKSEICLSFRTLLNCFPSLGTALGVHRGMT